MNGMWGKPSIRTAALSLLVFALGSASAQDDAAPPAETPPANQAPPASDAAPASEAAKADAAAAAQPDQAPPPPYEQTVPVQQAASEAAPDDKKREEVKLEKVEVTGTRLKRTDYETAQPVVTISRQDIERTGLTDISEILRQLSVAGNGSTMAQDARLELSLGETSINLRDIGAQHTLILVNGRRWVTGLVATQPSVSDLNTIPTAIIERIEILKDGASAVYGSDAIGGVVNIITRKDFTGLALQEQVGGYPQQSDGFNQQFSASWGHVWPNTSVFLDFSYTGQDKTPVENRELTTSPEPGTGFTRWSGVTQDGRFEFISYPFAQTYYQCPNLQAGIAAGAAGDPLGGPIAMTGVIPAGLSLCDIVHNPNSSGNSLSDFHRRDLNNLKPGDLYNRFAEGSLTEPSRRAAWFAQVNQHLTDHISFNFDLFFNRRSSFTVGQNLYIAGGNLFAPGADRGYIPATNPNNPFGQDIGRDDSCIATGGSTSPTCTNIGPGAGLWLIRQKPGDNIWGFSDRANTWRLGGGLTGDFSFFDRPYSWDAGYIYSSSRITELSPLYRWDHEAQALGTEGTCTDPCVPLDVFHGSAGLTPDMVRWLYHDTYQRNRNRQDIFYVDVSGDIGLLENYMAGPIAVATGIEVRRDQYFSQVDPVVQQGLTILNTQLDSGGSTTAKEAYLELGIPIVKDVLMLNDIDIDLAGRLSNYPRFGTVATGKAGLRYKPFEDLLIRGTFSTGFRAPNIGELFLGPTQSYDGLNDPCIDQATQTTADNCSADGPTTGGTGGLAITPYDLWIGNPDLKPEKSHNLTYGLVLSPRFIRDLNINVDFYSIEITNFIAVGLGQFYLDSCYKQTNRNYCNYIHRNSIGDLLYVDAPYFNYSSLKTAGVDFGFDYVLPIPGDWDLGRFKIQAEASYLKQFDQILPQPGASDQTFGSVGQEGAFDGYPRVKGGANLTWKRNWLNFSWSANVRYHLMESCEDGFTPSLSDLGLCSDPNNTFPDGSPNPQNKLRTVWYHNAQLGFDLPWYGANITVGVNNIFDRDPPQSYGIYHLLWYNYDPNHYEAPGRFAYAKVGMKF